MITIEIVDSSRRRKEENKMNKKKIIVTVFWKNYFKTLTQFEANPKYEGYNISEDRKFYDIYTLDGKISIPVENVQYIKEQDISA